MQAAILSTKAFTTRQCQRILKRNHVCDNLISRKGKKKCCKFQAESATESCWTGENFQFFSGVRKSGELASLVLISTKISWFVSVYFLAEEPAIIACCISDFTIQTITASTRCKKAHVGSRSLRCDTTFHVLIQTFSIHSNIPNHCSCNNQGYLFC